MASIHHEVFIAVDPDSVWRAAREVDRLHDRLVPGFVSATERLDGEGAPVRRVTRGASEAATDQVIAALRSGKIKGKRLTVGFAVSAVILAIMMTN